MIIFKKIKWKNLLSTGNIFTEIELNKTSTTLIIGENGAGKSTLLDVITFALFGKPFRNINKPQLINSITKKNLVVELEFSIGKTNYKIIRGIKPNVFEVYKNDKLLNQSAESKDYQEILEKQILKFNYKSFCQVVVLGSASYTPFMELPALQRREVIEDLLDLQIFTTMNSLLKDKITENNNNIKECTNNITLTNDRINIIKEHIIYLQNNNEKIIEEKKERIVEADKRIDDLKINLNELNENVVILEKKISGLDKLKISISEMDKLKHQIEAKISVLANDIEFFNEHDNCPTCKQTIDEKFKCESVKEKTSEIDHINDNLSTLISKYEKSKKKLDDIFKIIDHINDVKMEIHKIKSRIISFNEYKEQLLTDINNQKNVDDEDGASKIIEYENDINKYTEQYNELQNQKNLYACAATLLKDSGIKAKIIKQYIPIINKLINKYLSSMEFMCQFELNENFNETIKSRYRDVFSYGSFSEGEKFRINLAILFAWRSVAKMRNSIHTNILIMDEVMDSSLDINGTDEFLKIIDNLTKDTNSFIISHKNDTIIDKFNNVIRFHKYQNFSRIET